MNDSSSPSGSNASAPVLKAQGSANKAARRAKQAAALKANMQRRKKSALRSLPLPSADVRDERSSGLAQPTAALGSLPPSSSEERDTTDSER